MRTFASLLILVAAGSSADDPVDRLTRALRDRDRGVRYAAVQALGKARAGMAPVIAMLEDPEWCVRQAAGAAARRFGEAAVPGLERVLRKGSFPARVEAVEALGWIGKAGVPALVRALHDERLRVVLEALDALWRCREWVKDLPVKRLLELGENRDLDLSLAAFLLLATMPNHAERARDEIEARFEGRRQRIAERALSVKKMRTVHEPVTLPPLAPLAQLLTAELDAETIVQIGHHRAQSATARLRTLLASPDARLRGAATWALGRIGIELPEMLRDPDPVVRELAVATITPKTALRLLQTGTVSERRLAARIVVSEAALQDPDVVVRIEAARKLGKGLNDPQRDVRIAAALASGDPRALRDPDIWVRTAALRTVRTAADQVAPYLEHGDPYISRTAADALIRQKAAGEVAARIGKAHLGVLHYAPEIYAAIGPKAASTASTLIPLLKHPDPNVREVAARCLGATRAKAAAPALTEALADRRLPVVANAALALGRIGITSALLAALQSDRARVRAYAAFAIGQARADDPISYQPRLPVLDCGERSRVTEARNLAALTDLPREDRIRVCRAGIKSSDPRIAIPCAAALDFDEMGPWATERCIELLAPEGFRPGNPVDFEKYRSYLGPSELPATLEYLFYPRTLDPERAYLLANLHRSPRASNIPALIRFENRADHLRIDGFSELTQPFSHSARFREERGIDKIWELAARDHKLWAPDRWWLRDLEFGNERARLLVEIAARNAGNDHARVALGMLARLDDPFSEGFLEKVGEDRIYALAALAKRGHPIALADLVEQAGKESYALGLLIEFRPRLAAEILRNKLPEANWAERVLDAQDDSYYTGTRWRIEQFLGIEPLLELGDAPVEAIVSTAVGVPGCRTKRLADAAFRKLDRLPAAWIGDYDAPDPNTAFLWSADPARTVALLRTWATSKDPKTFDFARRRLFWMGDPESAPLIAEWITKDPEAVDLREVPLSLRLPAVQRALKVKRWCELNYWNYDQPDARTWLKKNPQASWDSYDYKRTDWIRTELDKRWKDRGIASTPYVLMQLALWPDPLARRELWSIYRAGRYRWVVYRGDEYDLTLGRDLSTLPHWIDALESNCCVISGRLEGAFEKWFGIENLYSSTSSGVGQPPSERVLDFFALYGGDLVFCPMFGRFVAKPD